MGSPAAGTVSQTSPFSTVSLAAFLTSTVKPWLDRVFVASVSVQPITSGTSMVLLPRLTLISTTLFREMGSFSGMLW